MISDFKYAFLIGAPKSGTTALVDWLGRHPEVYALPVKEPGFFRTKAGRSVLNAHRPNEVHIIPPDHPMRSETAYRALAENARVGQWLLDGSTDYLSDKGAPERIRDFTVGREVRIICMLRDPVDRAHSQYRHTRRDGLEPLSFRAALDAEEARMAGGYQPLFFHLRRSRYHGDLARYIATFGEERVLLLDHAEFKAEPGALAGRLCGFLGLGSVDLGAPSQLNVSKPPALGRGSAATGLRERAKSAISRLIGRRDRIDRSVEPLSEADRNYVFERLEDDIRACVAAPHIPTGTWTTAAPHLRQKSR
jgi:ribosomal protein L34